MMRGRKTLEPKMDKKNETATAPATAAKGKPGRKPTTDEARRAAGLAPLTAEEKAELQRKREAAKPPEIAAPLTDLAAAFASPKRVRRTATINRDQIVALIRAARVMPRNAEEIAVDLATGSVDIASTDGTEESLSATWDGKLTVSWLD